MRHGLRVMLFAPLFSATMALATCPLPGDVAPGRLSTDAAAWMAAGDQRVSAADIVALGRLAARDWTLAPAPCRRPDDIAPGVLRAGTWSPQGNGVVDACDSRPLRDVVLGRASLAFDPSLDAATVAGLLVDSLREREAAALDGELGDDAFLAEIASLLEANDATPWGPELLEAWLEGTASHECQLDVPPPPAPGAVLQAQGQPVADIARIRATRSFVVIRALVDSLEFDSSRRLLSRNPGVVVVLTGVLARTEILDAFHRGVISAEERDNLLPETGVNPFESHLDILGPLQEPDPDWATRSPEGCQRACDPELCAGGLDEDVDGLADCDDTDCAADLRCAGPAPPGPDDALTVALLHGDDDDGVASALDATGKSWEGVVSGLPLGDHAAGGFPPGALRFDGTRGATAVSPDFDFGTGDFTIDWWAFVEHGGSGAMEGHRRMVTLGSTQMSLQVATEWSRASGRVALWAGNGSSWIVLEQAGSTSIFDGWHHLALVRAGDTLTVFVDGNPEIVAPMPSGWTVPGEPRVTLGHMHASSDGYLMVGWMDEIRVTRGLARWTTDFAPPSRRYDGVATGPDADGTVALLHGEGIDGSATFVDETGRAWTPLSGATRISHAEARFGAGSLRIEFGSGLVTPASPDFDFGAGDFTIETWAWFDSVTDSWDFICARGSDPSHLMQLYRFGDTLWFNETATIGNISGAGLVARQWQHLAVTRAGGTFRLFIDGHLVAEQHHAGAVLDGGDVFGIGNRPPAPDGFSGYLDEFRVSKGVARWTADFTPPALRYDPPAGNAALAGTVALLHGERGGDASVIVDETGREWAQLNGDVRSTSEHSRFGGGSLRLTREGYLAATASPDFDFGAGDFTMETWAWFESVDGNFDMIFGRGVSDGGRFLLYRWSNHLVFYDGATVGNISGPGLTAQAWHHCAVTRKDGTFRVFIDGAKVAEAHDDRPVLDAGGDFMIGQQPIYPYGFAGYLDEIRIVKGAAAWDSSFTPPGAPYPAP